MMKKELLIIVYKINIKGLTRQQAEEQMYRLINKSSMNSDEELKNDYIIKEIWLPITKGQSDVKIIYPTSQDPEISKLIKDISKNIKTYPNLELATSWNKTVRNLKLRKIKLDNE